MKYTGLILNSKGEIVCLHKYSEGWINIPEKYRSKSNYETYCTIGYMGMDVEEIFKEKIREIE